MKELSTEQKAKRYNEVLEKARKELQTCGSTDCEAARQIFRFFPELKKSDDEIRKALIKYFSYKDGSSHALDDITPKQILAWLEKQGEHLENYDEAEKEKADFVGDGFIECHADFLDFKEENTYWLEYIGDDKYNVRSDNLLGKTYHITPCQLYTVFKKLTWLEKQDEQKSTDNLTQQEAMDIAVAKCFNEQKSDDKVEPKFHEGDWSVSNLDGKARQISEVHFDEHNSYYMVNGMPVDIEEFDRRHRLWTIQDANNGDVLSDGTTIFIFKDLLSDGSVMSYCDYDTIDSGESDAFCSLSMNLMCSKITPATKEQRDLLFQKMKEAGYKWDADRKELRKIEQKPIIEMKSPEESLGISSEEYNKIVDECIYGDDKATWSEEDKNRINRLIAYLEDKESFTAEDGIVYANWLKSIKPQNTWKPSDEQIKALEHFVCSVGESGYASPYNDNTKLLYSLLEQLKKLKG